MKKKERLLRSMASIDEKYVAEADGRVLRGGRRVKPRAALIAACVALAMVSMCLWMFIPYNIAPPDISQYADSEYFEVIEKLNTVTFRPPADKNNFEKYVENFFDGFLPKATEDSAFNYLGFDATAATGTNGVKYDSSADSQYVEVTDNQVQGVIEGDLFKRTRDRAFYLNDNTLSVYSIEGEESRLLGSYRVDPIFDVAGYFYYNRGELYLSNDGNTVTLVFPYQINSKGAQVGVIALDVSRPEGIRQKAVISISGGYVSSRSVGGKILLVSEFYVGMNPDFSDEANFIPQIKTEDEEFGIPIGSIVAPEVLSGPRYTVICELDQETLALDGCSALLSYSNEIYVSGDSIYATRGFAHRETDSDRVTTTTQKTEITRLYYGGEGFELMGSVTVDGSVKDQYSLDEYEGMLRAVTTTSVSKIKETVFEDGNAIAEFVGDNRGTNANLYIIDAQTMSLLKTVESFAPWGESVRSARFDGEIAYVCTSVQLSDPVFFFDLSDIDNITWKDTGTIEGFSSSLINFGDGFLLGIGRGDSWSTVKVEVYEESENGVISVSSFVVENASYADYYKSYFIDREQGLVGLGIRSYSNEQQTADYNGYVLLHFDLYELREVTHIPMGGDLANMRAFMADGYFYLFGGDGLVVKKIS